MFVFIKDYFQTETASSTVLAIMVVLAMVVANCPLAYYYNQLHTHGPELFINHGLMTFFFLGIGIELKREIREGELSNWGQALLPVAAAWGGVVCPALIYMGFNGGTDAMRGWAVPMATDIAFALGLVGLFGSRLPPALRVFLMALAVIDDVMAIIVIAVFYTSELSIQALCMAGGILGLLVAYNRLVNRLPPFLLAGAALWVAMQASGVHPTLAGVVLGLLLPMQKGKQILHYLHAPVAFVIVPLFVFANAGLSLAGLDAGALMQPVPAGIALGLFAGKQLGIFGVSALMIKMGLAKLPEGASWAQFYGVCVVAGIGFTMSLFIGTLAFGASDAMGAVQVGVIIGSLAYILFGGIVLAFALTAKGPAL